MKKNLLEYQGKHWKIEADHTHALFVTKFKENGIVQTELIEKEGCPEEISSLLKNKIYKLLYAWNVKLLSREILLKNGTIKYRQTATIQAQGINGEGKKFTEENKELSDNPENAILDTPEEKMKTKMTELGKKVTLKTWLLFVGIVSLSVAIGVTLYKLINRIK